MSSGIRQYSVKELFFTLQGEGGQAGQAAVFLRFAGCNLWSGREQHRAAAVCRFCDTEFVGTDGPGGGQFHGADALAEQVLACWLATAGDAGPRLVVCTGGEPALQLDTALVAALHQRQFRIAVETNGTLALPDGIDWVCVSPKGTAPLKVTCGQELKLVYPQTEPQAQPGQFAGLAFEHFFLQPLDGPELAANTAACIRFCQRHPQWRLSVQTHKVLGIP